MVEVIPICVGAFAMNCHLVFDPQTKDAVVIDPGDEIERIEKILLDKDLKVHQILITHAHIDHIYRAEELRQKLDLEIWGHELSLPMAQMVQKQAMMYGFPPGPLPEVKAKLVPGEKICFGSLEFEVLFTPGHSPDSVTFYMKEERVAIAGDVLFQGSIGRTDLPGGSMEILMNSIFETLVPLGEDLVVYPGHGPKTTIGEEKRSNPFLLNR